MKVQFWGNLAWHCYPHWFRNAQEMWEAPWAISSPDCYPYSPPSIDVSYLNYKHWWLPNGVFLMPLFLLHLLVDFLLWEISSHLFVNVHDCIWGFPGGSDGKECWSPGFDPPLRRSPGEGNGNPLQYSCLGNPTERGARRATVRGVTKSQTWLRD